ncbi:GPS-CTERM domain-containing protein, partial [Streptomyces californicus]
VVLRGAGRVPVTGSAPLRSTARSRSVRGRRRLCAISGYPKSGCGEQVSGDSGSAEPSAPAKTPGDRAGGEEDDGGGPSVGLVVGIGAVLLLGVAAVVQARRRR